MMVARYSLSTCVLIYLLLVSHGQITQKSLQDAQHPQRLFLCLVEGVGRLFSRLFCKRYGL